jgi:hypothetical protein
VKTVQKMIRAMKSPVYFRYDGRGLNAQDNKLHSITMESREDQLQRRDRNSIHYSGDVRMVDDAITGLLKVGSTAICRHCSKVWIQGATTGIHAFVPAPVDGMLYIVKPAPDWWPNKVNALLYSQIVSEFPELSRT